MTLEELREIIEQANRPVSVEVQPEVTMKHWQLVHIAFSNDKEATVIVGTYERFGEESGRRSTPIVLVEKHNDSDFEYLAISQSGRKYILPRKTEYISDAKSIYPSRVMSETVSYFIESLPFNAAQKPVKMKDFFELMEKSND